MPQAGGEERTRRQQYSELTLDQLADQMAGPREGGSGTGTHNYQSAVAEFTRRQTEAQVQAAEAQKDAAGAAQETARYTRRSAYFILLSVIAIALGAVITAGASVLAALHAFRPN
jgi:hypothetical protein